MIRNRIIILVLLIIGHALMTLPAAAGEKPLSCGGGILISREIKPYIEMVESLERHLDMPLCRAFLDPAGQMKSLDFPVSRFENLNWKFFVAVGPDALAWLASNPVNIPVFYGMVLEPDQIIDPSDRFCGVTFNLFTAHRINQIKQILPKLSRMAVIYNPETNRIVKEILDHFSRVPGVSAIPVPVTSRNGITNAMEMVAVQADSIYFIPDHTVISPAIVKHIIEYGISRGIPAIGYNPFFHESGAVLSLSVDYEAVGRQLAEMITGYQDSGYCLAREPEADILFNGKVAKLLRMEVQEQFLTR